MPYIKFDDLDIYYVRKGFGNPLILLHGSSVASGMFKHEIEYFSENYDTIAVDYPGHGKSSRVKRFRDYFWYYNACAVNELLDRLNLNDTYVIGTSGGALTAMNLASSFPGKVSKMILDSYIGESLSKAEALYFSNNVLKGLESTLATAFWKELHGDDWHDVVMQESNFLHRLSQIEIPIVKNGLENILCETLSVVSLEDGLIPNIKARTTKTCSKIKNCRSVIYDYGKHPFMITQKEEFKRLAMEFLGV
jgi:pimeloyl-ACP methyl ester carboxylesterase